MLKLLGLAASMQAIEQLRDRLKRGAIAYGFFAVASLLALVAISLLATALWMTLAQGVGALAATVWLGGGIGFLAIVAALSGSLFIRAPRVIAIEEPLTFSVAHASPSTPRQRESLLPAAVFLAAVGYSIGSRIFSRSH